MVTRIALLMAALTASAFSQQGQNVSIYGGVNPNPVTLFSDPVSATQTYYCTAASFVGTATSSVSSATAANPAVFTTSSDHGFFAANWPTRPRVRIVGAAGTWAALSASTAEWILVPISSTTFSLKTPNSGADFDGTGLGALTAGVTMQSNAPRLTSPIWAIRLVTYSGGSPSNLISAIMAYSNTGGYAANVCANRTSTGLEWK